MKSYHKIITPYLMGQRREGLGRIGEIESSWEVLKVPDFKKTEITDQNEAVRRTGEIYSLLSEKVSEVIGNGSVPVSVAGDCVSALGVLAGLQKANKQPGRILWLDAHGDFHTWKTTQTKYVGGMSLAMLVGRGDQRIAEAVGLRPYPEDRIVLSDARDLDSGEKETIRDSGIIRCDISDVFKYFAPDESLYLHWDTDVVDAKAEMPALKYHVKFGPTYSEISSLFKSLKDKSIVAISVSAWYEEKDIDNKTVSACLQLLKELGLGTSLV